jgi:hypothetical protein
MQVIDLIGAQVNLPGSNNGGGGGGGGGGSGDRGGSGGDRGGSGRDDSNGGGNQGGGNQGGGNQGGGNQGGGGSRGGGGNSNNNQNTVPPLPSPFLNDPLWLAENLPILLDEVSSSKGMWIPGRINIHEAPRAILAGVPGIGDELADQIISARQMLEDPENLDPNRRFETWLVTSGIMTMDEFKAKNLLPFFLSGGGDVFRAQVVGFFGDGGASSRAEVVFDATKATPRIVFWRDLSHLGRGYPLDLLGAPAEQE